jgi:hypothetical protein
MRRLRRLSPPNQEKDQETDDNHQNATDEDQSRWHTACSRYDATPRKRGRAQEVNGFDTCLWQFPDDGPRLAGGVPARPSYLQSDSDFDRVQDGAQNNHG